MRTGKACLNETEVCGLVVNYQDSALEVVQIQLLRGLLILLIHFVQEHVDHVLIFLGDVTLGPLFLVLIDDLVQERIYSNFQRLHAPLGTRAQNPQPRHVVSDEECPLQNEELLNDLLELMSLGFLHGGGIRACGESSVEHHSRHHIGGQCVELQLEVHRLPLLRILQDGPDHETSRLMSE